MKRIHVLYTGNVHGVGFRMTVERLALDLGVKGWVKNLPNDQVELLAEQKEGVLNDLLKGINKYFAHYIHNADIDWQEARAEFEDFRIRF